jgi:glutamine amidotransferase
MTDIVIIDYGMGNLRSVTRGLEHAGADVTISSDPAVMSKADAVVLPGVGAFQNAMKNRWTRRHMCAQDHEADRQHQRDAQTLCG